MGIAAACWWSQFPITIAIRLKRDFLQGNIWFG
jgi:hypothetical protein